ncbi:MAG: dnaE [Fibrobacteres bacterium]|nr:dnaE [Fibrobacterota bacterium]
MPALPLKSTPPGLVDAAVSSAFVHLHVHSEFSLLSGVPPIEALVAKAKFLGMKALALTDTNRMSGLILFYKECLAQDIHPILGVELSEAARPGETVVLLARNAGGYGDICELITQRQLGAKTFSFAKAFEREWKDLIILTSFPRCLKILASGPNRPRLYGELVRNSPQARVRSREVEAVCLAEDLPVTAAHDCFFLERRDFETHRILRAIDLNSTLSRLKEGETAPEGAWFASQAQMYELFQDRPDALRNSVAIADACDVRLELNKWIMPEIEVPKGYTPDTYLAELTRQGLETNYGGSPDYLQACDIQEKELKVIGKLGYSSYFLMVKEVRDWASGELGSPFRRARDCSILRGSGANSITFYNLGVCNLDPIGLKLYFERFLNEDRAAPPDADLDFGWDERDLALQWMVKRFGRDRVAITCTTNHFNYKSAFREVAKVFGYSDAQATAVLDSFDTNSLCLDDKGIRNIHEWVKRIHKKPRFLGQHPGGLIVTNERICRHVACEWSRSSADGGGEGRIVTQVDMHNGIDELGLIKFDLLGNGSLSVLRDALGQIEEQRLPDPEVWDLQKCFDDPAVHKMLVTGKTRGIFYIESPAQIRLNQKARAATFPEIVITSSLIRPAGTAYCKTFVERHRKMKDEIKDWDFVHPSLEGLLGDTHDVCAFQEDVIRICHEVAGLPYKLADRIRKMMNSQHEGAPSTQEWEEIRLQFIAGCKDKERHRPPFNDAQAQELWKRVSSFTGFSFCKSHSASYAELSFQCAHLKSRYPAQFLSSVISNRHGFYTRDVYLDEARRWGLRILPLDVNKSRLKYHGKDKWIRPGLIPVRDCRDTALTVLVQEREENGEYRDLIDLLQRVPLHKREAENLILAGACGGFKMTQPELLYLLDAAYGKIRPEQADLFAAPASAASISGTAVSQAPGEGGSGVTPNARLREYPLLQRCMNELKMLGYVLSANLLDIVEDHEASVGAVRADDLGSHVGRHVKVFGIPVTDRLHPIVRESGSDYMKFLTLGDKTGCVDVIFWPKALDRWNDVLAGQVPFSGNLLEVWGKVSEDSGTYSVEAEHVRVVKWLPNQINFEIASRRLSEGLRNYPAYANGVESLAA